mmetsp:Transcript_22828/g.46947  ORF Transcript_22828/g.46947 Transcript_22828/m.46947 type:complete len:484 (+) Transcript_22828:337-1788(+)
MSSLQEQQQVNNGPPCVSSFFGTNEIPFSNSSTHEMNIEKNKPTVAMPSSDENECRDLTSVLSHRNKIRLLYFFYRISTGSIIPVMSLYMQHAGWSSDQIGKLQSIRPIMTMLSAPMWGGLADRTGRKRLVLMTTFVTSAIFRLFVRFTEGNFVLLATALCATSFFYSATTSLLDSIVVSTLPENEKRNFGKLRLWGEIGNGVSSSTMMYVVNKFDHGFDYAFLIHGISSVVALAFMVFCVPDDCANQSTAKEVSTNGTHLRNNTLIFRNGTTWKEGARMVFGNSQILTLFSMVAVTGYSLGFLENFCYINLRQIYTKHGQMSLAGRDISLCRVFTSLGGVLCWFYSGSLQSRFGPDSVMFSSVCCLPLCFFLYAGIGGRLGPATKAGFLLSEAIRSGIFAALWSTATVRLNELSPPDMKAIAQTIMESVYRGLGHTSGSYFGGILCHEYGSAANAFILVGRVLLTFLCVVGAVGFMKPARKK